MTEKLEINPVHDPESLNRTLQQHGRLQVHDFFTPDTAEHLYKLLVETRIGTWRTIMAITTMRARWSNSTP